MHALLETGLKDYEENAFMAETNVIMAIKSSAPYSLARKTYYALRNWGQTKEDIRVWRQIHRYKNAAHGGPCVVIGNGPSLRMEDLGELRRLGIPTLACNRIFLAFEQTEWRPTYYFMSDRNLIRSYNGEMDAFQDVACFFPRRFREAVSHGNYYNELDFDFRREGRFSLDAAKGVYPGGSITTEMLQFAYYMGYSEIYLIGVDFSYSITAPKNKNTYSYQGENNYFIKGYLKPGEVADMPNFAANLMAFQAARDAIEGQGRAVRNATRGGKLEVFERADLDELLKKWERERE